MILAKVPLRITLGGGGTDLPQFYEKEGGFWISGAINKHIYVLVKPRFEKTIRVAYSALEYVEHPNELEHPIIRTVLTEMNLTEHIEIATFSDLPSKLGLGSSGAFTVALIAALRKYKKMGVDNYSNHQQVAEEAYYTERVMLNRSVGKQDHYSAAYGWVNAFKISNKGIVYATELHIPKIRFLEARLSLFFVGKRITPTNNFLKKIPFTYLEAIKRIGLESLDSIEERDINRFGSLVKEHWNLKRSIFPENKKFDSYIQHGLKHGAIGGKLIGAGGGGTIMFVSETIKDKEKLVNAIQKTGLIHIPFQFVERGLKVLEL